MSDTLKTSYDGWDITVRCMRFRVPMPKGEGGRNSYTASGWATRANDEGDTNWTDSRTQVATLGGRIFDTTATCADVLMTEMRALIDGLRRIDRPART